MNLKGINFTSWKDDLNIDGKFVVCSHNGKIQYF